MSGFSGCPMLIRLGSSAKAALDWGHHKMDNVEQPRIWGIGLV